MLDPKLLSPIQNIRFKNAIERKPQAVPPIWFMRQAGRYHKHYQAIRAKHSFMDLCKVPELAVETTMGPIRDFDFDVAILFSDLLFPLEVLGMGLEYTDAGPKLGWHLNTAENLAKISKISQDEALSKLQFQAEALKGLKTELPNDKSLIGFVGGPWTLFSYAVQGTHSGNLIEAKSKISYFETFCETLVPLLIANIELQLKAGAEVVMIFDTAAGELSPELFKNLVEPQLKKMISAIPEGRIGYYSKGTTWSHYEGGWILNSAPVAGLGLDHRFSLPDVFAKTQRGFVQGNFDQGLLFLPTQEFEKALDSYISNFKKLSPEQRTPWVSGLGHGVLPKTPEAHVKHMVNRIREVLSK